MNSNSSINNSQFAGPRQRPNSHDRTERRRGGIGRKSGKHRLVRTHSHVIKLDRMKPLLQKAKNVIVQGTICTVVVLN